MNTAQEIETAVRRLSPQERVSFRAWFAEYDADEWDRQLEADAVAGRLDWLIEEGNVNLEAGRCKEQDQPPAAL